MTRANTTTRVWGMCNRFSHECLSGGTTVADPVGFIRAILGRGFGLFEGAPGERGARLHQPAAPGDDAVDLEIPRRQQHQVGVVTSRQLALSAQLEDCLLYTSDAADDLLCVDLGGRRI